MIAPLFHLFPVSSATSPRAGSEERELGAELGFRQLPGVAGRAPLPSGEQAGLCGNNSICLLGCEVTGMESSVASTSVLLAVDLGAPRIPH